MSTDHTHIGQLLSRYRRSEASEGEKTALFRYLYENNLQKTLLPYMQEAWKTAQPLDFFQPGELEKMADTVLSRIRHHEAEAPVRRMAWVRYAAILLLIAGTATYLYITSTPSFRRNPGVTKHHGAPKPQDILPGSDKAVLTLAGGEQIRLDSNASALLAAKGISNQDALLRYTNPPAVATTNTLTTPRGGQYRLKLPDGTLVWLNAATSITYPTAFAGNKREVLVNGEAYFEVAASKDKPFIIKTASDIIQVLGTSFNVNAYPDEPAVRTTLVEGAVKVGATLLKPGQAFSAGRLTPGNIDKDLAWKNGFIHFEGKPLEQVMREIARWYDIEVVYQQGVPNVTLGGEMGRNVSLSAMIAGLESVELHVKLEGRRLTVLSK